MAPVIAVRAPARASSGQKGGGALAPDEEPVASGPRVSAGQTAPPLGAFEALYDEHVSFVWRSLRRLGVAEGSLDDAVQDVFLVVYRRFSEFEGRSSVKTWLFGIVLRVSRNHRRSARRKDPEALAPGGLADPDAVGDEAGRPDEAAERSEAARALYALLDTLDDEKREVFVLAELEQMTAPEIAEALGVNPNTVYSRLRAARRDFEQGVARLRARDGWRVR